MGVSQGDVREWRSPEAALVVCAPGEQGWEARAFLVDEGRAMEMPLQIERDCPVGAMTAGNRVPE